MTIAIRPFKNTDRETITHLIQEFYMEGTYVKTITSEKIEKTFYELEKHPEKGFILIVEDETKTIGYAILIQYWSNEFGGNILHIDELYILPSYRGKGIGTQFLNHIIEQKINQPVALQLEITKNNKKARDFYKKFGFKKSQYDRLILEYE